MLEIVISCTAHAVGNPPSLLTGPASVIISIIVFNPNTGTQNIQLVVYYNIYTPHHKHQKNPVTGFFPSLPHNKTPMTLEQEGGLKAQENKGQSN